jgi:hypothetical protein
LCRNIGLRVGHLLCVPSLGWFSFSVS